MTAAIGQSAFGLTSGHTAAITTSATGSTFYAVIWSNNGTGPTVTISDSKVNAFTRIGTQFTNSGNSGWIDRFYCPNGVGGAGHTMTPAGISGNFWTAAAFFELTGCSVTPLDQSNAVYTGGSGNPFSSGNITIAPPTTGEIMVSLAMVMDGGANLTFTNSSGFTIQDQFGNTGNTSMQYAIATDIVTAANTYACSWSVSATGLACVGIIDSFKGLAGGGGPSNQPLLTTGVALAPLAWVIRRRQIRAKERNAELRSWKHDDASGLILPTYKRAA